MEYEKSALSNGGPSLLSCLQPDNLSSSVAIAQVCNNLYQNPEAPHLKFLLFSLSKFRKNKKTKISMVKNFPF